VRATNATSGGHSLRNETQLCLFMFVWTMFHLHRSFLKEPPFLSKNSCKTKINISLKGTVYPKALSFFYGSVFPIDNCNLFNCCFSSQLYEFISCNSDFFSQNCETYRHSQFWVIIRKRQTFPSELTVSISQFRLYNLRL